MKSNISMDGGLSVNQATWILEMAFMTKVVMGTWSEWWTVVKVTEKSHRNTEWLSQRSFECDV